MTPARIEEILYNSEVALRAVDLEVSTLRAMPNRDGGAGSTSLAWGTDASTGSAAEG
ncbi:MAG: hypothetical protein NTU67_04090 [Gemmatimonadetes bacterium]|nr:hypothetical protein [Gemmatimonadota bacterium]